MVLHTDACQPRDELIREADALGWTEVVAGAEAVELFEGLEIVVVGPFRGGEDGAEGG